MCELSTDGPLVIVAGIDGSDSSMRAAAYAFGLGRRQGATVVFGYIRPLGTGTPTVAALCPRPDWTSRPTWRRRSGTGRSGCRMTTGPAGSSASGKATPSTAWSKLADRLKADAVVIGASQKAGHRVLGSVAIRLVKAGRWPVTVVP